MDNFFKPTFFQKLNARHYGVLAFLLALFLMPADLFAQNLTAPSEDNRSQLVIFFTDNWKWLLAFAVELVTRAIPNWDSISILRTLLNVIDLLVPDLKSQGASHGDFGPKSIPTISSWIGRVVPFFIATVVLFAMYIPGYVDQHIGKDKWDGVAYFIPIIAVYGILYLLLKPKKE